MPRYEQHQGPGLSFDDWINSDCLDYPTNTVELPAPATSSNLNTPPIYARNHAISPDFRSISTSRASSKDRLAPLNISHSNTWPSPLAAPYSAASTLPEMTSNATDFSFDPIADSYANNTFDFTTPPPELASPTSSLSGSDSPFSIPATMTSIDTSSERRSLKRASPESPSMDEIPPAPKRMLRTRTNTLSKVDVEAAAPRPTTKTRQPHNQVEKKYREGLNTELERLRRAVRTLPQPQPRRRSSTSSDDEYGYSAAAPKPSKAAVLAGAVEYIRYLEAEHERLISENEQLRELEGLRRRREQGMYWGRGRIDSMGMVN
ncbi:uncharacterized protein K452DRAFT_287984 [Aplosporella prunicola CBS 121167]|uniref:BHLH domain-containing protein n=1 Tax=Aplosporella prunicola CBS 121167 TaxID=1176127 RepID=A0A6A6BDA4_9PEZI|nr:uncharacterized protein K452DRAFT_287984 [Aplosporella prunicola CBS 121167]KAF2141275.1 hypothetical protein K452DRAFT_287984 [Aplosporella prunicola CBS 121167]